MESWWERFLGRGVKERSLFIALRIICGEMVVEIPLSKV